MYTLMLETEDEDDADSGDATYARKLQQEDTAAQRAAAQQLRSDEEIARALQAELDNEEGVVPIWKLNVKLNKIK